MNKSPGYSIIYNLETGESKKYPPSQYSRAVKQFASLRNQSVKARLVTGLKK